MTTPTSSAPSATPSSPAVSVSAAFPAPTLSSIASDQHIKKYVYSSAGFIFLPACFSA